MLKIRQLTMRDIANTAACNDKPITKHCVYARNFNHIVMLLIYYYDGKPVKQQGPQFLDVFCTKNALFNGLNLSPKTRQNSPSSVYNFKYFPEL